MQARARVTDLAWLRWHREPAMDLSGFTEADRMRLMRIMEEKQVRTAHAARSHASHAARAHASHGAPSCSRFAALTAS